MITQSIHLQITGQDAHYLLEFCQKNNTEPKEVFGLFLKSLNINDDNISHINQSKSTKTNAERLGMSLSDLQKVGEIEFARITDLPREIEL